MTTPLLPELPQAGQPFSDVATAGRPSAEHFALAKERGIKRVINLCPHGEPCAYDEPELMAQLGLDYVNIPVAGPSDLSVDKARELDAALQTATGPVLVHCASSNRVGALFALRAFHLERKSPEEALAIGRSAGLKAMEPVVRQLLGA
jgi:uncharacterized protein (TIGR01244 family)